MKIWIHYLHSMALDLKIFKTRAISGLIFAAIFLVGLLWNQWSFLILFSVIHFGCWNEYQKLIALIDPGYRRISPLHRYGVMVVGWAFMLYFTNADYRIATISLHTFGSWLGLVMVVLLAALEVLFIAKIDWRNIGYSALGLAYISLSLGLFTSLRNTYAGGSLEYVDKILVLMIVASIWINDTMAYIVGSLIGKTPLTKISPKKTWEGTLGGIVLSIAVMGLIGSRVNEFDWNVILQWMVIAAISSIAGTFGDLLQSKLKRMAQVKDSGQLLPGHGGFLDRFDSLLVASPFVWLYVHLFSI
jgi:phosphatidate cytidylyltransferase